LEAVGGGGEGEVGEFAGAVGCWGGGVGGGGGGGGGAGGGGGGGVGVGVAETW